MRYRRSAMADSVSERSAVDAIYDFMTLLSASSRSPRQRERLRKVLHVPITPAGMAALRLIQRHQGLTVGELGRRLDLDQSTVSRQVRPLEEQGLVTRETDAVDGRVSRLSVSPQGERLMERIEAIARNDFAVAVADWSEADRERLAVLLDRLRTDLLTQTTDESGWSVR